MDARFNSGPRRRGTGRVEIALILLIVGPVAGCLFVFSKVPTCVGPYASDCGMRAKAPKICAKAYPLDKKAGRTHLNRAEYMRGCIEAQTD